jgi:mRNA interferase HicA
MRSAELKRILAPLGAEFAPGKGSHLKVILRGRRTVIPMHAGDLKPGTLHAILRQLGLRSEDLE